MYSSGPLYMDEQRQDVQIEPTYSSSVPIWDVGHTGHCWRSRGELINDVLLWTSLHGRAKAGRPDRTYIQQLCADMGCTPEDIPKAIDDREVWRERVRNIRANSVVKFQFSGTIYNSSLSQPYGFFIA